ncbi:transporter [Caballeronia udeis]|uniref:Transporter n=1 Tax=Caballeronia udeis TaxID=1232866 RepID=A0A158JLS9_9BURK|nr:YadA-like family protein [Caballeronia udeis]SAL69389.1 transporter [Caballeronia udeis]
MNTSYKTVWNETTQAYVAASEVAKSRGGKSRGKKALLGILLATGLADSGFALADGFSSGSGAVAVGANDTAVGNNAYTSSKTCPGQAVSDYSSSFGYSASASGCSATAIGNGAQAGTAALASTSTYTTAVGGGAQALAVQSTALGSNAIASQDNATAVGAFSQAKGVSAFAMGAQAKALADDSWANGTSATVNTGASRSIAVGSNSSIAANMTDSLAMGSSSTVSSLGSMAIGSSTNVGTGANNSTAIGYKAQVNNNATNSMALGANSVASVANSVSVGAAGSERQIVNVAAAKQGTGAVNYAQLQAAGLTVDTSGNATNSFVAYDDATQGKVTLGGASGTVLTHVAAGEVSESSTDAVNGSQLHTTNLNVTQNTTDIAKNATDITNVDSRVTTVANSVTDITNQLNSGEVGLVQQDQTTRNLTVGAATDGLQISMAGAAGNRVVTGVAAGGVSESSTEAVNGSQLYGVSQSVADAMGGGSSVNEDGSVTKPQYDIGGNTFGNVGDALTNLDGRTTQNTDNIATMSSALKDINSGGGMTYFHSNSMLPDSQVTGTDSVAIGGNAQASANGSVALGANSVADRANAVSVGSAGNERQISNVAAGTADTDAVNVAQLKATGVIDSNGNTKAVVTYDHNADGSANYGSATMGDGVPGGTTIHNVAAGVDDADAVNVAQMNAAIGDLATIAANAAANVSNPLIAVDSDPAAKAATASGKHATAIGANAAASGTNAVAMGAGAVASADNSVALGANSVADRANSVSVGAAGSERQVTNVADGTQGTDAVNLNQLNAAATQSNNYTDGRIAGVQSQLNQVSKSAYAGVAAAMAMPNLTPSGPGKTIVAAGGAVYKGQSATAVGVTHRSENNRWTTNGAVSVTSSGDAGVRAQVGYEF